MPRAYPDVCENVRTDVVHPGPWTIGPDGSPGAVREVYAARAIGVGLSRRPRDISTPIDDTPDLQEIVDRAGAIFASGAGLQSAKRRERVPIRIVEIDIAGAHANADRAGVLFVLVGDDGEDRALRRSVSIAI